MSKHKLHRRDMGVVFHHVEDEEEMTPEMMAEAEELFAEMLFKAWKKSKGLATVNATLSATGTVTEGQSEIENGKIGCGGRAA